MGRETLEAIAILGAVVGLSCVVGNREEKTPVKATATPYASLYETTRSVVTVAENGTIPELYIRFKEENSEPKMIPLRDYLANIRDDKERMNEFDRIRKALFPDDK